MSHVVIIGGHGKVALHLARKLSSEGHRVDSLFRNPDHTDEVAATGAAPFVADVEQLDSDAIAKLLQGTDAVVWSAGAGGGSPERTYAVDRDAAIRSMDAAKQAGVKRYVMVSYAGSSPNHGVDPDNPFFAYADAKNAADEYLRSTDLDWTVLGPTRLTLEPATGSIEVGDDRASEEVSRENVALVVAATLADDSTIGRTIDFSDGPVPIADAIGPSAS